MWREGYAGQVEGRRSGSMKRRWSVEELHEHWSVSPAERDLLFRKEHVGRLGFVAQLAFYRIFLSFPEHRGDFSPVVLAYLAEQIEVNVATLDEYEWGGRTGRRHREAILEHFGVRAFDDDEEETFRAWLLSDVLPQEPNADTLEEWITAWLQRSKVDRPSPYRFERALRAAKHAHEQHVFAHVHHPLEAGMRARLDALLGDEAFEQVRADTGRVGLKSLLADVEKLKRLRALALPAGILRPFHTDLVNRYRRRAATESIWELKRRPDEIRLPLLVFYCVPREADLVDGLVELLLQITHKMVRKAERRVTETWVAEFEAVRGKTSLLYRIAEAAAQEPDGIVRDVIFPVASEETIEKLVKEYRASRARLKEQVHTVLRGSYASHYRRMLPKLLDILEFRSNNALHRPLLDAIDTIQSRRNEQKQHYKVSEIVVEGVIRPKWQGVVIEDGPDGEKRVNRMNYELCVLQSLRDPVRCKEVWIAGAKRFRNPDEDLPNGFADRRSTCYERLGIPLAASAFIDSLRTEMTSGLERLHDPLPHNPHVRLDPHRKKKPIRVSKLEAQPEPPNLAALKTELGQRWPMTSLLDILKETDLRIGFTDVFATAATRETVDRDEVQRRLLLCLYGMGTNAGLKRLGVGNGVSYKELLHTRRRYLDKSSFRDAIRRIVNATLAARQMDVWGEVTSSVAADSKKFAAYDQNLMTEWHVRYGGRGVMVYWHVERKAACIYSQLKRCSSSEVAAMIEGVLHHGTEVDVERQYVDSHGQSEIAFAFCRLLGFSLLPRLKAIASQKLYVPTPGRAASYPNLGPILTRSIDWDLIRTQYDEMARYATALQERTADAESILRRFTRSNVQHPTYRALAELGKAVKSPLNFACFHAAVGPTQKAASMLGCVQ
jgi:TnpA family transposase